MVGDTVTVHSKGYATDRKFKNIHLLPEDMQVDLVTQAASWTDTNGETQSIRILPGHDYVHPSGYKIRLEKHPASNGKCGQKIACACILLAHMKDLAHRIYCIVS